MTKKILKKYYLIKINKLKKVHFNILLVAKSDTGFVLLCLKPPQLNGCGKYFDNDSKCIKFLVHNKRTIKSIQCNMGYNY